MVMTDKQKADLAALKHAMNLVKKGQPLVTLFVDKKPNRIARRKKKKVQR